MKPYKLFLTQRQDKYCIGALLPDVLNRRWVKVVSLKRTKNKDEYAVMVITVDMKRRSKP